jgi:CheY-like chemotaxis protein
MESVRDEPNAIDDAVDRSLRHSAELVRVSTEVVRALDEAITEKERAITAADAAIERTNEVLAEVDVDLAGMERRQEDGAPPPARVLIVDDNPSIRQVLRLLIGSECGSQAEVRTVASGAEAIDAAGWLPQVVILDWQMPGMDGAETARRLRARLGDDPRIVLYSASGRAEAEVEALAAGADLFVEKGTEADALVAAVQDAVAGRDRRRAGRR